MKKNNKKGFTIVELVIVIAVIGILAGVLIPTFSSAARKARLSADQQAVRQMNTTLAAESISDDDLTIFDIFDILAEDGMDAQDYKALTKNAYFFYDAEIKRVLLVQDGVAVYPEEFEGRTANGQWLSLSQKVEKEAVTVTDNVATVATAGQFVSALEKADKKDANTINLNGNTVDMMGATVTVNDMEKGETVTIEGGTIKNATAVEAKQKGKGTITSGNDGIYNMAMVTNVAKGATLHLKNVTIENMNLKDTNAGNCGFLVGTLAGKLILENVTISNSSIIGYTSVGALVGQMTGTAEIEIIGELKLENVTVQAIGGRVGQLIGYLADAKDKADDTTIFDAKISGKITMHNVTNTIYECEQNTGACVADGCTHGALGLDGNIIHSWAVEGNGVVGCEKKENRVFNANSLIGYAANAGTNYNTELEDKITLART